MIVTELYNGQGLGNQIWCYVVTRSIAKELGLEYGIMSPHKFKGQDFLDIDFGNPVVGGDGPEGGPPTSLPEGIDFYYKEKVSSHPSNGVNISKKDPSMLDIGDRTKIDGCMQSLDYLVEVEEIEKWVRTKEGKEIDEFSNNNICVIHVRGGDFMGSTSILSESYYRRSMEEMKVQNPLMDFVIVTDDVEYVRRILPEYKIVGGSSSGHSDERKASHHIGGPIWMDWSIIKRSKYLILSASSFSFWPAFLNREAKKIIAPMYWGDHKRSDGYWSCWDMIVDGWEYLDKMENLYSSDECKIKREEYEKNKLWQH